MEEKVNFAVVGVFVLVLGAALIAGVLWFSSGKSYRRIYDIYQTYYEGIGIGTEPQCAGALPGRRGRSRAQDRAGAGKCRAGAVDA